MSTLGALKILTAEVHVPSSGAWWAHVTLDSSTLPALGSTTLSIGDLSLVGQVIRTDYDDNPRGAKPYAVVRGGAGWRKPVTMAGSYAGSVRLSTILTDVAAMSGESYVAPADAPIGNYYAWQAHTAAAPVHCEDILADLVSRGALPTWRVDPATGQTRFDAWPSIGAADGRGRVTSRNLSRYRRTVGLDVSVAAFLPGATLEGATVSRLLIHESSGALTADVFLDSTITAHQSIRRVLVQLFPWLPDLVLAAGAKGSGLAIRAAGGLLHLAGGPSDPAVARVGDVAGYEYLEVVTSGGNVVTVALYRSAANGTASSWSLVASGAVPPVNGVTVGTPITITTGSAKVTCG